MRYLVAATEESGVSPARDRQHREGDGPTAAGYRAPS